MHARLECELAATIFEIIGVVAIVVAVLVAILVLPFLSRMLKSFNKSGVKRAQQVRSQVTESIQDMNQAQEQLDAFAEVSKGVRAGMDAAVERASRTVAFLESRTFQVGLPALMWFLLLVVALPRGLRRSNMMRKPRRSIPPPSWEAELDASEE